jgi:hypothetical protein
MMRIIPDVRRLKETLRLRISNCTFQTTDCTVLRRKVCRHTHTHTLTHKLFEILLSYYNNTSVLFLQHTSRTRTHTKLNVIFSVLQVTKLSLHHATVTGMIWEGSRGKNVNVDGRGFMQKLSDHMREETEKFHAKLQSQKAVSRLRREPGTHRSQV